MGTRSAVLLRALLGVTVIMVQTILKLAFLATTAIAALQLMLRLILSMAWLMLTLLPLCMPYQSVRPSLRLWWWVRDVTLSPSAPQNLWWSVRPSRDMRTQSVLRSRFLLSATDTLARERLRLNLSTASPTVLTSLYL